MVALCIQGCALHYTEDDGTERIIGLVDMRVSPPNPSSSVAGRAIDIQMIGLGVIQSDAGASLLLGYARERSAYLKDHSFVAGDPLGLALATRDTR
jgi:hypothetical protein